MSDNVTTALIVAVVGPVVLFLLGRIFGGRRRDRTDEASKLTAMWEKWADEQGERIKSLESRVGDLEKALAEERAANQTLQEKNARLSALLTDLIRWAILLRDEVIRLGGSVPPAPTAVESALTNLEP